jgi:hypothetical protein
MLSTTALLELPTSKLPTSYTRVYASTNAAAIAFAQRPRPRHRQSPPLLHHPSLALGPRPWLHTRSHPTAKTRNASSSHLVFPSCGLTLVALSVRPAPGFHAFKQGCAVRHHKPHLLHHTLLGSQAAWTRYITWVPRPTYAPKRNKARGMQSFRSGHARSVNVSWCDTGHPAVRRFCCLRYHATSVIRDHVRPKLQLVIRRQTHFIFLRCQGRRHRIMV